MRSRGWILRACFGAVVFFSVVWLLFVGILANHATTTTTVTVPSTEILKQPRNLIQKEKLHVRRDLDLNYGSKRRVPNGPDPIHNRKAAKCRQPPGRV